MPGTMTPRSAGPKIMTSRLANMKFMQRAAASSPFANTPTQTPDHHISKRQKVHNSTATPTSTGTSTLIPTPDEHTPRLPWNTAGETEWVLSTSISHNPPSPSSSSDSPWSHTLPRGRQSYGSFKRRKATNNTNADDDLSSISVSDTHPLRPMQRPQDREKEEAAQGRRLDRIDLSRMEGVSGSAATTGAGMKRREKGAYPNKGQNGKGNGAYKNNGGVQKSKKRKTM